MWLKMGKKKTSKIGSMEIAKNLYLNYTVFYYYYYFNFYWLGYFGVSYNFFFGPGKLDTILSREPSFSIES